MKAGRASDSGIHDLNPQNQSSILHRFRWWIAAAALLSFGPAFYLSLLALGTNENKVADWLPTTTPEMRQFHWFCQVFEGDEILVVSWDGCTLDDPRLDAFADAVVEPFPDRRGVNQVWFAWVRTGRSVLRELTAEPLSLERAEAVRRMANWVVGYDGNKTCAVLKVSDAGRDDRHSALAAVHAAAQRACNLAPNNLYVGGSTFDSVAIDDESQRSLRLLLMISLVIAVAGSLILVRNVRYVCFILITAGLCEAWSLALVRLVGTNMDLVLIMMPILVGILAVSASIHQLNYYTHERIHRGVEDAAVRALRQSWKPASFSCLTMSLGMLSLMISDVAPVRKFGFFSATGICVSLVALFCFLPAAVECFPAAARKAAISTNDERIESRRRYRRSWARTFARGSVRRYGTILFVCGMTLPVLTYGVTQIRTSVKLQDMFSPRSEIITNYRWLEENIGPLVPVEIVVGFAANSATAMADRLKLVERVRSAIDDIDKVGGTLSAAVFAPPLPAGGGISQTAMRRIILRKLEKQKPRLREAHYLASYDNEELWRISARVETFNDIDYGRFLERLRAVVDPIIADENKKAGESVRALVTGGIPTVYVVQRQLLEDLRSSFGTAFIAIAAVLAFALRSVRGGLVTMIPNVFPILIVFGVMGLADIVVDLGSMMTISTALGISVDNELHFFTWFRKALACGHSRHRALLTAYRRCGRSMAQTAAICCLGMLVFTFSPFTPVSRFGALMSSLIALAMTGDQLLLPALLVSPLGSFYRSRSVASPRPRNSPVVEQSLDPILPERSTGSVRSAASITAAPDKAASR